MTQLSSTAFDPVQPFCVTGPGTFGVEPGAEAEPFL